jgi:parallel beta-helix repeat protein
MSHENSVKTPASINSVIKVDDDGDGDYTRIADAVRNATAGDTIEVYSGTYNEIAIKVNKTLYIRGIAEELGAGTGVGKPVVDGQNFSGSVFRLEATGVEISGFVITNGGGNAQDAGIRIWGAYHNNLIADNDITYCFTGILFNSGATNTTVRGNTFRHNEKYGINCAATSYNHTIYYNSFYKDLETSTAYSSSNIGNRWNVTLGNWWVDYIGLDANHDGIGDTPYEISGPSDEFDYRPLLWQPPDSGKPTMDITQPKERSIYLLGNYLVQRFLNLTKPLIIGQINIIVNASDSQSGIAKVEFYIDGVLKGTDTTAPYNYTWTGQSKLFNNTHTVKAVAFDRAGYSAEDEILVAKIF